MKNRFEPKLTEAIRDGCIRVLTEFQEHLLYELRHERLSESHLEDLKVGCDLLYALNQPKTTLYVLTRDGNILMVAPDLSIPMKPVHMARILRDNLYLERGKSQWDKLFAFLRNDKTIRETLMDDETDTAPSTPVSDTQTSPSEMTDIPSMHDLRDRLVRDTGIPEARTTEARTTEEMAPEANHREHERDHNHRGHKDVITIQSDDDMERTESDAMAPKDESEDNTSNNTDKLEGPPRVENKCPTSPYAMLTSYVRTTDGHTTESPAIPSYNLMMLPIDLKVVSTLSRRDIDVLCKVTGGAYTKILTDMSAKAVELPEATDRTDPPVISTRGAYTNILTDMSAKAVELPKATDRTDPPVISTRRPIENDYGCNIKTSSTGSWTSNTYAYTGTSHQRNIDTLRNPHHPIQQHLKALANIENGFLVRNLRFDKIIIIRSEKITYQLVKDSICQQYSEPFMDFNNAVHRFNVDLFSRFHRDSPCKKLIELGNAESLYFPEGMTCYGRKKDEIERLVLENMWTLQSSETKVITINQSLYSSLPEYLRRMDLKTFTITMSGPKEKRAWQPQGGPQKVARTQV